MRNLLVFAAIVLLALQSRAQQDSVSIELSVEEKMKQSHVKKIVYADDNYFFTVGTDDKKISKSKPGCVVFLRRYLESSLTLDKEWEYEIPGHKGALPYYKAAVNNSKGCHILLEAYDASKQTKYLLHMPVNYNGEAGQITEMAAVNCTSINARDFELKFSKDNNFLGIFLNVEEEASNQLPMFYMFDAGMEKMWQRVAKSNLDDKTTFSITQMEVTNQGYLAILGYRKKVIFTEGKVLTDEKDALLFYRDEQNSQVVDLADIEEYIYSLELFCDVDDKIVLLGTYSEPDTRKPQGSIMVSYNQQSLERINFSMEKFDKRLMAQLPDIHEDVNKVKVDIKDNFRVAGYGRDGLRHVKYVDLAVWPDGRYTAIAQRRYTRNYTFGDPAAFFFEDYVIVQMDKNGQITHSEAIPFASSGQPLQRGALGHLFNQTEDMVYLIMNDSKGNISKLKNREIDEKLKWGGYGCTVWQITRGNQINFTRALEYEKVNGPIFFPQHSFKVNQNKSLVLFQDLYERKICFAKVTYP